MFSFRSIFIAAVALATLTSAIPVTPAGGVSKDLSTDPDVTSEIPDLLNPDHLVNGGILDSTTADTGLGKSLLDGLHDTSKRADSTSPGDVINDRKASIAPLASKLDDLIKKKDFEHDEVSDLLKKIEKLLQDIIDDLNVILSGDVDKGVLLTLKGLPCTLKDLAAVVNSLLCLVIPLLARVLKLVLGDSELCDLLYAVAALLVKIVGIVLGLVKGLDAVLVKLLTPLVGDIKLAHAGDILTLAGYVQ